MAMTIKYSLSHKVEVSERSETSKTANWASNWLFESTFFFKKIIACHKVEISERFKSHRLELKGQSSNLKHVEKIDGWKLNGKNDDLHK